MNRTLGLEKKWLILSMKFKKSMTQTERLSMLLTKKKIKEKLK